MADTEEDIVQLFGRLNDSEGFPKLLAYVNSIWIDEYKESFVACWTDTIMHFKIHQQTGMILVIRIRYRVIFIYLLYNVVIINLSYLFIILPFQS